VFVETFDARGEILGTATERHRERPIENAIFRRGFPNIHFCGDWHE
jgi:hypothetical protein